MTASPPVQTTAGLGSPSSSAEAAGAAGAGATEAPSTTMTTAAVAGGVVGGLAILSLIAFLIFFLRRRSKRKRRSTLLTSMFGDPGFGRREKETVVYTINRTSLGPTPVSEKMKNSFVYGYKRFRDRVSGLGRSRSDSPKPTIDLDRGTSQFGPPLSSTSSRRSSSRAGNNDDDGDDGDDAPTAKERFFGWWGRLGRSGPPKSNRTNNEPFAGARAIRRVSSNEKAAPSNTQQPDFLTLLKMDEEAARKSAGGAGGAKGRNSKRRSPSQDHFLGSLGFDFEGAMGVSPFSDDNAIRPTSNDGSGSVRHDSATIPPLALAKGGDDDASNNPFSDANAVTSNGGPTTYVQDIRRSRGRSATVNGSNNNNGSNAAAVAAAIAARRSSNRRSSNYGFLNRESGLSVDSDMYKRNTKFRSDPFDLDRPELLSASRSGSRDMNRDSQRSSQYSSAGGIGAPPRARAHTRGESYASWTSRYSGISEGGDISINTNANTIANANSRAGGNAKAANTSLDDWSEPGPDVGPAVASKKRSSKGSVGSVGKAL